jgi:hypothetical protein
MPEQPDTDYITREAPRPGAIPVHVKGDLLDLTIIPSPRLATAAVHLSGPGADEARAHWEKDGWHIDWPEIPPAVISGRGVTVVQGGRGGVTVAGGDVYVSGRGRSVHVRGGSGVTIGNGNVQFSSFGSGGSFSVVNVGGGVVIGDGEAGEMPTAVLYVPADSQVHALVEDGEITASGAAGAGLTLLAYQGHNANVTAHCPLGHLASQSHNGNLYADGPTGSVQVSTHNGHTTIAQALGQTTVQSHNGGVEVHAMDSVMIQAVTHNGSVDVTAEPGATPMVQASSYNGRVRKP